MLQKIVLLHILAHGGEVEAVFAAVVFVGPEHVQPIASLGLVEGVGLLGDLKGGFAAEKGQGLVEVHHHLVLIVQVEVQFLHLPKAVLRRGLGELFRVRRVRYGLPAVPAHQTVAHVLRVFKIVLNVFPHDVVGDDHLGLEAADLSGDLLLQAQPILLLGDEEHGERPHAAVPETVQGLPMPVRLGHVAVDHLDPQAPLRRVGGDDAAHHDQLVVGVAGHQHDIALLRGHLPQVDVRRHAGRVVYVPFRQPAAAFPVAPDHLQGHTPRPFRHGEVPPFPLPVADAGGQGPVIRVIEGIAALVRRQDPFPVDDAHGHVAGPVDAALAARLQVRAAGVPVVRESGGKVAKALPVQGAPVVEQGIRLGGRRSIPLRPGEGQGQQQQEQQKKQMFFHRRPL